MKYPFSQKIFLLVLILFFATSFKNVFSSDYFSIEEYNENHPEQKNIGENFTKIVKADGFPIKPGIQKKTIKISFIDPGEQVSDYWQRNFSSFKARIDEIKLKYNLKKYSSKPAVDYRIQEKHIKSALDKNPDYLVFTLDIKKHKRIIERIIIKGTPKLILQNITTPLKSWEGKQPFFYVGFDHAKGSKLIADYLINKTGASGKYAMLYFSRGYVSEMRGDTFIEYLNKKSDLELVSSYFTDGNKSKSKRATHQIMNEYSDIKFIFSCSTDVALGAVDAFDEQSQYGNVIINGWGGGSSELEAIKNKTMDVTVMRMNDDQGVAMAEAIKLDIEGWENQVPKVFSGDFELIEKGITREKLETYKKRAFRYSGTY